MTVQLEYINCLLKFSKIFPIMLPLCLMLSVTYYAQNYAGIIGWSLVFGRWYHWYGSYNSVMLVNRKAVVIYGSMDLWIYWDKADKLRLFYTDISHNLCAKRVGTR